jgi:hypothetical protein
MAARSAATRWRRRRRWSKHEIRVSVSWDDNERVEHTFANFEAGARRELEIKLGRIKKDLKLEWK